jgi:hypothetical protein
VFGFFKTKTKTVPVVEEVPVSERDTSPPHLRSDIQKELIRMVLRETLRFHGIPIEWIKSDVRRVPGKDGTGTTQIHLVVWHWNEQLLRYSAVLEKKLQFRLAQYEPGQQPSRFEIVWRYHERCNCPLVDMPDESVWTVSKTTPTAQPFFLHDSGRIADTERAFAPTNVSPLTK